MPGVIFTRAIGVSPIAPIDVINQQLNLTSQIDGVTDTFEIGQPFTNLRLFYNGRLLPTDSVISIAGTQVTLDFIPKQRPGKGLYAIVDAPTP